MPLTADFVTRRLQQLAATTLEGGEREEIAAKRMDELVEHAKEQGHDGETEVPQGIKNLSPLVENTLRQDTVTTPNDGESKG